VSEVGMGKTENIRLLDWIGMGGWMHDGMFK
jgi:hypothetical protein